MGEGALAAPQLCAQNGQDCMRMLVAHRGSALPLFASCSAALQVECLENVNLLCPLWYLQAVNVSSPCWPPLRGKAADATHPKSLTVGDTGVLDCCIVLKRARSSVSHPLGVLLYIRLAHS
jgi:hypothetical protein